MRITVSLIVNLVANGMTADQILAEQKIRVILYRNAVTNVVTVERFDYLDE